MAAVQNKKTVVAQCAGKIYVAQCAGKITLLCRAMCGKNRLSLSRTTHTAFIARIKNLRTESSNRKNKKSTDGE